MITIGLAVFGFVALKKLPLNLLPDLSYPTLTLETRYPGAAPQEVEYLVTRPIEEAVAVISNVKTISSSSKPEMSHVTVEFNWGKQMDFAVLDISKKIDLLRFPDGVEKPKILRYDPNQDPIVKVSVTGDMPLTDLRFFGEEEIKKRLDSVPGLASVKIQGGLEEVIEIRLIESALKRFNLTIDQISQRLIAENINQAGGSLYENEARYLVRTMNEFKSLEDIKQTIVSREGDRKIYLSEIAEIVSSHKDREEITRMNGKEGIELAFYKEGDANTVQVSQAILKALDGLKERFKDKAEFNVTFKSAEFIENSIDEVISNAIFGGLIAICILFFFLRSIKATTIVALSIPISVLVTFFLMLQFKVSMNIMSLGGLALGIGMLVDSSIVVLESIFVKSQAGLSGTAAAEEGASEVSGAVFASTLTTVVVFLPILFVQGVGGQLFKDLGITVSFSLLASLVVSLTLIPTIFALWTRKKGLSKKLGDETKAPPTWYRALITTALRFRYLVLILAGLLLYQTIYLWKSLGVNLVPEMSQGEYFLLLELNEGTPIEKTDLIALNLEKQITDTEHVLQVYSNIGQFDQGVESRQGENLAQINFTLDVNAADPEETLNQIRSKIDADTNYRIGVPSYFSFKTPIEVEIYCDDQETLKKASQDVTSKMEETGLFKDIQSSVAKGNPEVIIHFNRELMSKMDLSIGDIANALRDKIQGATPTRFVRQGRDVDILVRLNEADRQSDSDLAMLTVGYMEGKPIFLSSIATLEHKTGPSQIKRIGQRRTAVISAGLTGNDLGLASATLEPLLKKVEQEYQSENSETEINLSGQNTEMKDSFKSLFFAIALAIFLVYLVMASQFESLFHPFLILFTVPMGLFGGLAALKLTGLDLSIVALIGLVMLAGIVVNNAIVLIDYINHLRRSGKDLYESLIEGGFRRMRPILMTTSTTVLGLLPMAMGMGEGSEIRAPLAVTVIGGLLISTILTLVIIPVLYGTFTRGLKLPDTASQPMDALQGEAL